MIQKKIENILQKKKYRCFIANSSSHFILPALCLRPATDTFHFLNIMFVLFSYNIILHRHYQCALQCR